MSTTCGKANRSMSLCLLLPAVGCICYAPCWLRRLPKMPWHIYRLRISWLAILRYLELEIDFTFRLLLESAEDKQPSHSVTRSCYMDSNMF